MRGDIKMFMKTKKVPTIQKINLPKALLLEFAL